MTEKKHETRCGTIHYWVDKQNASPISIIFLPGLTAYHRLFEKQIEYFENKFNVFVWEAPAYNYSWPFKFDFDLMDKAKWLDEILENVISRDNADMTRTISPLRRADDAVELDNSYMSVEEQMAWFMERYEAIVNA